MKDAGRSIGQAQSGNAQARHAADISRLALILAGVLAPVVNEGKFFRQGHLGEEAVDLGIAGDRGRIALRRGHVQSERQRRRAKRRAAAREMPGASFRCVHRVIVVIRALNFHMPSLAMTRPA